MEASRETIDRGIALYLELVREHAELRREYSSSLDYFFGGSVPEDVREHGLEGGPLEGEGEVAASRHLEWFLLERPSEALGTTPADGLHDRWRDRADEELESCSTTFLGSHPSIFEVTGVAAGHGVWVRDLAGFGEYPLDEPEGSNALEAGDVLVGRMYPVGESVYRISRAAGVFRNPLLREALRRDLSRAREGRRGVLRLEQRELERMFWGNSEVDGSGNDPIGDARKLLLNGGIDEPGTEEILSELASTPFDPDCLVHGAGDVLGAILDRLAFDTSIDLEEARHVLMRAWCSLSREGGGLNGNVLQPQRRKADEPETSQANVAEAIAEFDEKRAQGGDLDELFRELEQRLALDDGASGFDDAPDAPDFPGVVGAMIEEYLWELERERGEKERQDNELLRLFGRYAEHIGVFENLSVRDLLVFASLWIPEQGIVRAADEAAQLLSALRSFVRWADENQHLELREEFRQSSHGLMSSLPRVVEANRRRTRVTEPGQGELYELLSVTDDGSASIRDGGGGEHAVSLDPHLAEWLRGGDMLRGRRLEDGRFALYCSYPPECKVLGQPDESAADSGE